MGNFRLISRLYLVIVGISSFKESFSSPIASPTVYNKQSDPAISLIEIHEHAENQTYYPEDKNDCIYNHKTDFDSLSQNQILNLLTSDCRYDKLSKPDLATTIPLNVRLSMDIKQIELLDTQQFKMETSIQYRYVDHRLAFQRFSPGREYILGKDTVKNKIWIPHVVVPHERDAKVMGLEGKDVFVSISELGEVMYTYRTSVSISCDMDFRKFPFDTQTCKINFQCWLYNASKVLLLWEEKEPIRMAPQLHVTGFNLEQFWTTTLYIEPSIAGKGFGGNFSALEFKFKVNREMGHYIIDYFIPSIMLVCTSWITFWLQADASPPRVTLGTATMLSLITLASSQTKPLPKVSYIKISEIWFLSCATFIFLSLVEFAFVNIIWRRRKSVEVKRVNSKYIFKSTLTPSLARKELYRSNSRLGDGECSSPDTLDLPQEPVKITTDEPMQNGKKASKSWTTMTPHEVSNWIDKRSRIVFPVAFLLFNIFFWFSALSVAYD